MRFDFEVRSSNPPAPLLQAAVLAKPKSVARNVMEGGYTQRHVKSEIHLTKPQGKFKILAKFLLVGLLLLVYPYSSSAYLCGTPHLSNSGQQEEFVRQKPLNRQPTADTRQPNAPALPAAPALPIGAERTFFAPDFRSMQQYTVSAVLRGVGSFCYVFVEEAEWNTQVTAGTVQAIIRAFEAATPANPQQGIYSTLTKFFGAPPDIDGNGRVILLLLNIQDARGADRYTAGFFNPADQKRGLLRNPGFRKFPIRSNEAEMLYIDTQPLNPNSERAHNVIAHEFQHLLNWHHDSREVTWVDEGCAVYASFLCGYSVQEHVTAFEKMPSISLVTWPEGDADTLPHYGAAFLWMLYLHEQYGGIGTLVEIVQNRGTSLTGISGALASRGVLQTIPDLFIEWKLANYLSEYRAVTLSLTPRHWHHSYPSGAQQGQLRNFSAEYIGFRDAEGLTLGFSSSSPASSAVHAIEFHNTGTVDINEIKLSAGNTGSLVLANTAAEVILVPSLQMEAINVSAQSSTYQYSATRGAHITFITAALPNPVHPRYWDIIAESTEPLVGLTPTVTLMLSDGNRTERLYQEAQPMYLITQDLQDNRLYRFSFLLEPEIAPKSVIYQVSLDSRSVGTGSLF
ncbi:hypothetical protein F4X10_22875 [Candidatus Poribacteria bacterium]|nr:hypothetical protein [Candidatus Poribacteria bacterium]